MRERLFLAAILMLASCSPPARDKGIVESEDRSGSAALLSNARNGDDWPSYGRTYDETHFSPLQKVNETTIGKLGLSWAVDLPDVHNGGTTPLAVNGVIYFTVDQSIVRAVDAATGRVLWTHDPEVGKRTEKSVRFGWGPRGLAWWDGKIYVGTTDGRLIALDGKTGREVWSARTVADDGSYISGAPRAYGGLIVIGFGGGDFVQVRGYVSAYDAKTGALKWRFHTVPGDPKKGFENKAMEMAARTWTGEWWKFGGGGTVWNAITYDREQDLIYIGTGNGSPWNQKIRSPKGGDNLFLCSIIAIDAKTGEYRWHYQINPGETWDYNAAMDMTLATLAIDGRPRKVLMTAPKNGFFYILDRTTGKLISAEKIVQKMTWAKRIDLQTGRPVENADARYPKGTAVVWPGSAGAHSWAPMAFNHTTGLVYIPIIEMPTFYDDRGIDPAIWKPRQGFANPGITPSTGKVDPKSGSSYLLAWDPVTKKRVWSVPTPGVWNGGVLTTDGNLVFQGQGDGRFNAYRATDGKPLWSFQADKGISGGPITFTAKGEQYVAVVAGFGGAGAAYMGGLNAHLGWQLNHGMHQLLAFRLNAGGSLATPERSFAKPIDDKSFVVDPEKAKRGGEMFALGCAVCHGVGATAAGYAPDLRASQLPLNADAFRQIVKDGILVDRGMPRYGELSDAQLEDLQALHQVDGALSAATLLSTGPEAS